MCNLDLIYLHKDKLISDNYTTELMIKCYDGSVTIDYINNNIKDICKVDIDGMTALMYLNCNKCDLVECVKLLKKEISHKNTTLYALLFNNHLSITKYNKIIDKYL